MYIYTYISINLNIPTYREFDVDRVEVGREAREHAAGGRRVVPPDRRVENSLDRVAVHAVKRNE